MKIEFKLNKNADDIKLTIEANEMTEEISKLINTLNKYNIIDKLIVEKDDKTHFVKKKDIYCIYVYICTG